MPDYGPVRQLLLASVTTIRHGIGHDTACVIQPGEHPFVNERSYILYRDVRVVAETHAQKMVAAHVWTPHSVPFSPELLAKVIAGAQTSKFMPREFRQFVS